MPSSIKRLCLRRILATQPQGMEWIIEGDRRARYRFCLGSVNPAELSCLAQLLFCVFETLTLEESPCHRLLMVLN
jgi:hypothetical protein